MDTKDCIIVIYNKKEKKINLSIDPIEMNYHIERKAIPIYSTRNNGIVGFEDTDTVINLKLEGKIIK